MPPREHERRNLDAGKLVSDRVRVFVFVARIVGGIRFVTKEAVRRLFEGFGIDVSTVDPVLPHMPCSRFRLWGG
jgi:hypothetical protein